MNLRRTLTDPLKLRRSLSEKIFFPKLEGDLTSFKLVKAQHAGLFNMLDDYPLTFILDYIKTFPREQLILISFHNETCIIIKFFFSRGVLCFWYN